MADRKYPGINNLDLSLVARLVLENLVTRLLKGKAEDYLVTAWDLADEYGVDREVVREAFCELRDAGLLHSPVLDDPQDWEDGAVPTGVRLCALTVGTAVLFKDGQPRLGDEEAKKPREEVGKDVVYEGETSLTGTVVCNESGEFELSIEFAADPFDDGTIKVDKMPFGSNEEAWAYFDQYATPAVEDQPAFEEAPAEATADIADAPKKRGRPKKAVE